MLGKLRARYEKAMLPIGRKIATLGVTPNMLTLLSLAVSATIIPIFMKWGLLVGTLFIPLIGFMDMLDGSVARATNRVSRFGGVLDHVIDRYAEYFILCGFALGGYMDWSWSFYAMFGMVMASYTRAKAESIGGLKSCTVGIAERQEKLITLIIGALIAYFMQTHLKTIMNLTAFIVGTLSHITVIQRLLYTRRYADAI
ncbi:MAG TPA: CDP-alcohol phosphatidyltransferase family protein [Euryarchaeota archaeon]|nr:CDP-alcohol phosphatidyltransferase family protein [Euryarchaeota archaeon]